MAPSIQQLTETIFSVTSPKGVSIHATTNPMVPHPFRAKKDDVKYINAISLADHMRNVIGLGKCRALYMTHDVFVDQDGLSPLTSQLKCLCRINLQGSVDVREEEIIYDKIDKVDFQYWMTLEDNVIDHDDMMNLINEKRNHIDDKILRVFKNIDDHLLNGLEDLFVGKYPREIWSKLDMINVAKKPECLC